MGTCREYSSICFNSITTKFQHFDKLKRVLPKKEKSEIACLLLDLLKTDKDCADTIYIYEVCKIIISKNYLTVKILRRSTSSSMRANLSKFLLLFFAILYLLGLFFITFLKMVEQKINVAQR